MTKEMNIAAKYAKFFELVCKMREAQRVADRAMAESDDYSEALVYVNNAEELEKEVDNFLEKQGL